MMRKALVMLFIAVMAVGASGCKGDWTCVCTINGIEIPTFYGDIKKSDAKDACNELDEAAKEDDPDNHCDLEKGD